MRRHDPHGNRGFSKGPAVQSGDARATRRVHGLAEHPAAVGDGRPGPPKGVAESRPRLRTRRRRVPLLPVPPPRPTDRGGENEWPQHPIRAHLPTTAPVRTCSSRPTPSTTSSPHRRQDRRPRSTPAAAAGSGRDAVWSCRSTHPPWRAQHRLTPRGSPAGHTGFGRLRAFVEHKLRYADLAAGRVLRRLASRRYGALTAGAALGGLLVALDMGRARGARGVHCTCDLRAASRSRHRRAEN